MTGVFYGCDATGLHLGGMYDDDDSQEGLLDAWEKLPAIRRKGMRLDGHYPEGEGKPLVGFWIAVAGDPREKPGAVELPGQVTFMGVTRLPRIKTVLAAWPEVVALAKKRGIKLKAPSLWLVETEIA